MLVKEPIKVLDKKIFLKVGETYIECNLMNKEANLMKKEANLMNKEVNLINKEA